MKQQTGLIAYMISHPLAANLLMVVVLLAGFMTYGLMNVQFLPQFDIKLVRISAPWPGATPDDVEKNLLKPIENQLKGLNGVDFFESTAAYNSGTLMIELDADADMGQVYDEISDRVEGISDLPEDVEKLTVSRIVNYEPVARLVVTAEDTDSLNYYAQQIRDELFNSGIDQVYLSGNAAHKLQVQVPLKYLFQSNYSLASLAKLIQDAIRARPLGDIGAGSDATMLTVGEKIVSAEQLKRIAIKLPQYQSPVLVEDFATVAQVYSSSTPRVFSNGRPAVDMNLKRAQNTNTLDAADGLHAWLATSGEQFPFGLKFTVLEERWKLIRDRILLLVENGATGLILIFVLLFLFFNLRIAFWIAFGIPISFSAAIAILYLLGGSINMISLFALIMTLGIIVDDTIVVGEQAVSEFENGRDAESAAYFGATKMFAPVIAASFTTVAAFLPLLVLSSLMGQILREIPLVAITVILASLLECFVILPNHLMAAFKALKQKPIKQWRMRLLEHIHDFQYGTFRAMVAHSLAHPIQIFSVTVALFFGMYLLIAKDLVGFDFFPKPPSPNLYLDVRFNAGSTQAQRIKYLLDAEQALRDAVHILGNDQLVVTSVAYANKASPYQAGGLVRSQSGEKFGSMVIELLGPDQRDISNEQIKSQWVKLLPTSGVIESVAVQEPQGGPPGQDINIMFVGQSPEVLKAASVYFQSRLAAIPHVSNVADNLPYGKKVMNMKLSAKGKTLGLTLQAISSQLRSAINGVEIENYYDTGVEHPIEVVLSASDKQYPEQLAQYPITLPNGEQHLLGDCVDFELRGGFEMLRRYNGKSVVSIVGDVDKTKTTNALVLEKIKRDLLPDVESKYGVSFLFSKQDRYQKDTLPEMKMGSIMGLMIIYLVIAWISRSVIWPFIIMITIPLGVVGAVYGHFLMGLNITLLSLFGLFGLAGIVVNGSIILLLKYQELRRSGLEVEEASIMASCVRFRALMLTTLTTAGGLMPLLFERSLQAQYLIPMATSLVFGLVVSTAIMLFLVPVLIPWVERMRQT